MAEDQSDDRTTRALLDHAKSTPSDLYALLELPHPSLETSASAADIRKAWRNAARRLHPDKNRGDEVAAAGKLDEARKAYEVLADEAARRVYDERVRGRREREERERAFEGRRRAMKEDLERREAGASAGKRTFGEMSGEERREEEVRRLAEESRRWMRGREERLRREREREVLEEEERRRVEVERRGGGSAGGVDGGTAVPEVDRTVKVRWVRKEGGEDIDTERLARLFSQFGEVDNVMMLKDKKVRPDVSSGSGVADRRPKKQVMATAIVVFTSIVGAHAAVHDAPRKMAGDSEWSDFDSVVWAAGQAPELGSTTTHAPPSQPEVSSDHGASTSKVQPTSPTTAAGGAAPSKAPTFRFVPGAGDTRTGSAPGRPAAESPSLYEITMMRLKEAERQKMRDAIRREEASVL